MTNKESNHKIVDKEVAIGFIMFAFINAYQERFIGNIRTILKMAYENGFLWRYGFLMLFLSVYNILLYFIIFPILFVGYYAVITSEAELPGYAISFLFFLYASYVFIFILTRYLFPNILRLTSTMVGLYVILGFMYGGIELAQLNISTSELTLVPVLLSYAIALFIIPLSIYLDHLFRIIHFVIIYHAITLTSPKNSLLVLKKLLSILTPKGNANTLLQLFITIVQASFLIFYFLEISSFFSMYITIWLIYILFFIYHKYYKIVNIIFTFIVSLILFFGVYFYFEATVFLDNNTVMGVLLISMGLYAFFALGTASYVFYRLPSLILAKLVPNWYFAKKYRNLFNQNIDVLFEAFLVERIPRNRQIISQLILNSPSILEQKIEVLIKMGESEKKHINYSQEVLDELARTRQSLREEQRQAKLMSDVSPIIQNDYQIKSFDFIDPNIENNHFTILSPIDSARQQLLNWLKGETHAKPSIDKLLIQQWKDYEIGIGLKYSGQMGGDFYDLFQLPSTNADNKVGLFISDFGLLVGDLAGHGVETAVNLSKTHNFWVETDLSQDALTTMRAFEPNFKTTFHPFSNDEGCELCYVQLKENEITLSRAGLHIGLIRDNQWHKIALPPHENFCALGKWQSLPVKRCTRVELKAYDTLIVYTDGLFENRNQHGEQFCEDKLKALFLAQHRLEMNTFIDTVFRTVYEYCQPEQIEDDETLLVIRRTSSTA
ncbi:MAG: hypothetical protein DRR16_04110 [Candidatus Parabeggiatoa sp. nov. 3]|nr:MAG: hypothetical protein DRR00_08150 [Gammaproteobacteria bacterium]RKZ65067.1 MAG: hypothetical protein DRQ99_13785 [Gammaproteobacteria bacterium]RKZ88779.1 MAG: hypothetical protein DRR16_04110 [Gammaproteobacteria bacterium]